MKLEAHGLGVAYGAQVAVTNLSIIAHPGEVLAVLGANGSGKSSLLRALAGHQRHTGRIAWDGPAAAVGYMPQENSSRVALSAFEVVLLGRLRSLAFKVGQADLDAADSALDEIGIAHLSSRRIATLSGGQRQMVFIAQVLASMPRALLLDEPTSALDIAHQLQVLSLIREATRRRSLTTIAVLHDLNAAARFADRVALLHDGTMLACGTPADVLCPELLRVAYGVEAAVQLGPDNHPVVIPLSVTKDAVGSVRKS